MSRPSSGISEKAENGRRLVVSFHDLHPGSQEVCEYFLGRLAALGVGPVSLLVVPRWHGGPSITRAPDFVNWLHRLAAAGHDICLHGFFHRVERVSGGPLARLIGRHYTAGEGEYHQINRATARDRIARGLHILATEAGLPVTGFTPPAWLLSNEARAELVAAGLHYTTSFGAVDLLQLEQRLRAPTIVYSCRNRWRRVVSCIWVRFWSRVHRNAEILRIAAHPCDFAHPAIETSLWRHVRRALADGRTPVTYRDLLPGEVAPVRGPAAA